MNEDALQDQLKAVLRSQVESALANQAKRRDAERQVPDEVAWERELRTAFDLNYGLAVQMRDSRDKWLERRRAYLTKNPLDELEVILARRVRKILPAVIVVRRELGEEGPLTQDQVARADAKLGSREFADKLQIVQEAIRLEQDPRRRQFLSDLAEAIDAVDSAGTWIQSAETPLTEVNVQKMVGRMRESFGKLHRNAMEPGSGV